MEATPVERRDIRFGFGVETVMLETPARGREKTTTTEPASIFLRYKREALASRRRMAELMEVGK